MQNAQEMDKVAEKLTRPVNKSQEGVVPNLEKLTKPQLLELRDRQELLLRNKNRLQKLPDKGRRIQELHDRIEVRLRELDAVDEAAKMFSQLNIASRGQSALVNLEWTGKCHPKADLVVDSDDEEAPDPLKVLAQSRDTEKKVKVAKQVPLITEDDLMEIASFSHEPQATHLVETELKSVEKLQKLREKYAKPPQSDESRSTSSLSGTSAELEPHAVFLCTKETTTQAKDKFRPYQTTKSHVHSPQQEMERGGRKKWDITAATPPQLTHPGVKMLSLQESVELQMRKQEEVKALEKQQAERRLLEKSLKMVSSDLHAKDLNQFFKTYREVAEDDSLSDLSDSNDSLELDSEDEVKDPDAEEPKGGVVVKISH